MSAGAVTGTRVYVLAPSYEMFRAQYTVEPGHLWCDDVPTGEYLGSIESVRGRRFGVTDRFHFMPGWSLNPMYTAEFYGALEMSLEGTLEGEVFRRRMALMEGR